MPKTKTPASRLADPGAALSLDDAVQRINASILLAPNAEISFSLSFRADIPLTLMFDGPIGRDVLADALSEHGENYFQQLTYGHHSELCGVIRNLKVTEVHTDDEGASRT